MRASMDSQAIEEVAARWFARQHSGSWTDADELQFNAWLQEHTAHRIAHIRVTTAWDHAARMQALGAGIPKGVIPARGSWGDTRFLRGISPDTHPRPVAGESSASPQLPGAGIIPRSNRVRLVVVAVAAIVCAIGIYIANAVLFAGTHYSTPVGGINNVPLADGSHVTLNTDTSIRVAFTENERRIQLDKGEAFFAVAKDATRPFVVYAGDKRVIAVGTEFSVRRDHEDIQVVVTEGRVKLADAEVLATNGSSNAAAPAGAGIAIPPSTFLGAGAIARTSKKEILVRPGAASEAEKLLSWRNGYVVFDDTTLTDAVAEFNRYSTRKIFIADPAIAAIRVGGNFRSNNSDAFIWLLQSGFPIAVEQSEDKIVLKGR